MLHELSELDKAEFCQEFRRLYRERGYETCLQALYEILKGAELLSEILLEERAKESR